MSEFKPPVPGAAVAIETPTKKEGEVSPEQLAEMKERVVSMLRVIRTGMEPMDANSSLRKLNVEQSAEVRLSPEVQEAAIQAIIQSLHGARVETIKLIIKYFRISEETLRSSEIAPAAQEGALAMLREGNLSGMKSIAAQFHIPADFFQTREAKEAARVGVEKLSTYVTVREDLIAAIKSGFGL